jgi:multidrug resistance protein, MATE family
MNPPTKQSPAERTLCLSNLNIPQLLGPFTSFTPVAEASIVQDLQVDPGYRPHAASQLEPEHHNESKAPTVRQDDSMARIHAQPSFTASATRAVVGPPPTTAEPCRLTKQELETSSAEEQSLLWDNHMPPSKYPRKGTRSSGSFGERLSERLANTSPSFGGRRGGDEESALFSSDEDPEPSEATALLRDLKSPYGSIGTPAKTGKRWEEEVASGKIQTSWQQEAKVLARSSRSLILTFMLQYSLPVASISSVGHIGKIELGAVSIAAMTANITGYAVYQGLATSLDTLCAQAYGSGRKTLVGLQMQRMVYFLWLMTIPIGMIWLAGTQILEAIVPEKETAALAGLYLKIILVGSPGIAAFESGKRFVQAQGLFSATLYVLLFCAPLNAFLNWLFVWVGGHEFYTLRNY